MSNLWLWINEILRLLNEVKEASMYKNLKVKMEYLNVSIVAAIERINNKIKLSISNVKYSLNMPYVDNIKDIELDFPNKEQTETFLAEFITINGRYNFITVPISEDDYEHIRDEKEDSIIQVFVNPVHISDYVIFNQPYSVIPHAKIVLCYDQYESNTYYIQNPDSPFEPYYFKEKLIKFYNKNNIDITSETFGLDVTHTIKQKYYPSIFGITENLLGKNSYDYLN